MTPFSRRRGSALLISLAFLVIIAILVVGLAESMRLERSSSRTHLDRNRAMDFARMGVELVVGQLHSTIANTNVNWVSSPGRISFSSSWANPLTSNSDLYSGLGNTNLAGTLRAPDLNARLLSVTGTNHLITDRTKDPADPASGVVALSLRWIYVRQDGTQDPADSPIITNNPIIGRFAYWADDESSKINYNMAWKRSGNTSPMLSATAINLPSLPGMTVTNADAIHAAVTTNGYTNVSRFFNTPLDARHLGTNISALINSNKFETTHYNNDPDTTFFNEPRIVLTTQEKYAPKDSHGNLLRDANGAPYFLDILAAPNTDPGILSTTNVVSGVLNLVDSTKLNKTVNLLMRYLKRKDWPMTSYASSLQDKYYVGNEDRLPQLALNIIDYVRSKESTNSLVDALRGSYASGTFTPGIATAGGAFIGSPRTPMINEVGAWMDKFRTQLKIKVELYLPLNYGLDSVDLTQNSLNVGMYDDITGAAKQQFNSDAQIAAAECSPSTTLVAGNHVTVTCTFEINGSGAAHTRSFDNVTGTPHFSPRPATIYVRVGFSRLPLIGRTDICPLVMTWTESDLIHVPVDPQGTAEANIHSMEVDDPRVNKVNGNWKTNSIGNTFGGTNSICTVGTTPSGLTPQQDTDSSGKISDASLYMPYPKGHTNNPGGLVVSTGELGYVHTGVESSSTTSVGVPWRTLRLQPNNYANTSAVPDWAFMDLFTVPTAIPAAGAPIFLPHGAAIGGRVNVNAQVQPFGNPSLVNTNALERIYPLKAVLEGIPTNGGTLSAAQAETIARNISSHTLAANGKAYGNTNIYDSPGEVVEIAGVADGGEASEAVVRGIANIITSRGNVFSVYTIGQSLKQTPDGRLLVNGEQRIQAMVERYLDTSISPSVVRFRTVYFRNLTP